MSDVVLAATMSADTEAPQPSAKNFEKKTNISYYVVICSVQK